MMRLTAALLLAIACAGNLAAQTDRAAMLRVEWTRVRDLIVMRAPAAADLIDGDRPAPDAQVDQLEAKIGRAHV